MVIPSSHTIAENLEKEYFSPKALYHNEIQHIGDSPNPSWQLGEAVESPANVPLVRKNTVFAALFLKFRAWTGPIAGNNTDSTCSLLITPTCDLCEGGDLGRYGWYYG